MNYIFISIFAYGLNAGSTIIDKILLVKAVPTPLVYVFYINILGALAILLIPFGVKFEFYSAFLSYIAGIFFVFAVYFFFSALKFGEASVVAPIVGSLNPFFSLVLGSIFLRQLFSSQQYLAFYIILFGTAVLTFNLWFSKVKFNTQFASMLLSAICFAISYLALREAYLLSNFLTGLVHSRIAAAVLVASFLFLPKLRKQIFASNIAANRFANRTSLLLAAGQIMGGTSGLFINYAVYLANPALVNSLFGAQYLVILIAAVFLGRKNPQLLEERLSGRVLIQKIIGAIILSWGVYLLAL